MNRESDLELPIRRPPSAGYACGHRVMEGFLVCLLVLSHAACQPKQPVPTGGSHPSVPRLSDQQRNSIHELVESRGGRLLTNADGQLVGIDLLVGRGSADLLAIDAALRCPALTTLRARVGTLSSDDLNRLAQLPALQELYLQDAVLDDDGLQVLVQSLTDLRRLTLRNARHVSDQGVAHLVGLTRLTHLACIEMPLGNTAIDWLLRIPSLVSLDLRGCHELSASGVEKLANAHGLRELKLGGAGVDDAMLVELAKLPGLQSLTCEDASITGAGLTALAGARDTANRLHTLAFARCFTLDDDALQALHRMPNLRRLTLRDVPVTGAFLKGLPALENLERLSLNETYLAEEAFDAIANCRQLKRLELAQNALPPTAIAKIARLEKLEFLNVQGCGLAADALKPLAQLEKLKVVPELR